MFDRSGGTSTLTAVSNAEPLTAAAENLSQAERVEAAVRCAIEHLRSLQREDGHWCAELEGDTILESEYAMTLLFFGHGNDVHRDDPRFEQLSAFLRDRQGPDGGWPLFPGGAADVSPTVKAYFVLKLAGDDPEAEHMRRARERVLQLGGLEACNSFTKLFLSIFGVFSWKDAPAVPPELILAPRWFYLNIYEMSSWSRAIVVPLSVLWALKPERPVDVTLDELRTGIDRTARGRTTRQRFWFAFFRGVNRALHLAENVGAFKPVRRRALQECERWCLERLDRSGGLAAIVPAIANTAMAFSALGYDDEHPAVRSQLDELQKLEILEAGKLRLQPCFSPVWDTALSMNALLEAGVENRDPGLQSAASWVLDHEVREVGDWQVKCPEAKPGGWYFEYANEFYPDCDDTAEILAVLSKMEMSDGEQEVRRRAAVHRALEWHLAMQNRDGGWGAFDRECNRELFTYVPFADHNAMIDPSTVDVTSRSIEALLAHGYPADRGPVRCAVDFVLGEQKDDGSWYGRWGANYIYGTWLALGALQSAGEGDSYAARRGVEWLLSVQQADGAWGETLDSYSNPRQKRSGEPTAAQTSWALMGLIAVSRSVRGPLLQRIEQAIERGTEWLLANQNETGGWEDRAWTGTGFPGVFYLRYHYYDRYFPLQALAQVEAELEPRSTQPGAISLEKVVDP